MAHGSVTSLTCCGAVKTSRLTPYFQPVGQATFDFGVSKSFTLHEETTLQFRAEFFNLFNRANFSQPGMDVFSSIDRQGNPVPEPSAGQIQSTTGTSRQIQFALKILF